VVVYFHHRICDHDLAWIERTLVGELSRAFTVSRLPLPGAGARKYRIAEFSRGYMGGTATGRPLAPYVELILRLADGMTTEALVLRARHGTRPDVPLEQHARAVCEQILHALHKLPPRNVGFSGYWTTACGCYLHIGHVDFHLEERIVEEGCNCGGAWQRTTKGSCQVVDGFLVFHESERRPRWKPSITLIGNHTNTPPCTASHEQYDTDCTTKTRTMRIVEITDHQLLLQDRDHPIRDFIFRAIS